MARHKSKEMSSIKNERLNPANDWKVAIHESKESEKVVAFANDGYGMSDKWWNDTYKADQNGDLWGVYEVGSGLRRTI